MGFQKPEMKIEEVIKEAIRIKPIVLGDEIKYALAGAIDAYIGSWIDPIKKTIELLKDLAPFK